MDELKQQGRSGSQSVERAVSVLGLFDGDDRCLTLSEIADRTGLAASTAHRIVGALERGGLLQRSAADGSYAVGHTIIDLAVRALPRIDRVAAAPHLYLLAAEIGITASLGVAVEDEAVTLYSARPPIHWCDHQTPDPRGSLADSAMGQAITAFAGRGRGGRRDLALAARHRGYTVAAAPRGVTAIAVPVFDAAGRVRASIGVQARSERLNRALIPRVVPAMRQTAIRLTPVVTESRSSPTHISDTR